LPINAQKAVITGIYGVSGTENIYIAKTITNTLHKSIAASEDVQY
jgi:hypothetical protein